MKSKMGMAMDNRREHFMSYKRKAIYYNRLDDGTVCYMVAKGDRTDEYFADWKDAMDYIDRMKAAKSKKYGGK